jgi:transposase
MARRTYTREFKLRAVRRMTDQGLSVAEAARRPGVGEN